MRFAGEIKWKFLFLLSQLKKKKKKERKIGSCLSSVNKEVISFNLSLGFCYALKLGREWNGSRSSWSAREMHHFCFLSFSFWREMGLGIQSALESQSCMWSSSALVSVSCVHEWEWKQKNTKKKNIKREREKRREKTFIQTAAERKHNAVPFSRKSQGCPGSERLNYPFRKLKTKLKLQNFFYKSVSLSRPFGSSASISVTPLCCWLNTSEPCGIDPVVHPFYYLFSHPKAALRFDSATVVEKHKFSSPFAVRGRINGCEIKPWKANMAWWGILSWAH